MIDAILLYPRQVKCHWRELVQAKQALGVYIRNIPLTPNRILQVVATLSHEVAHIT